MSHPHLHRLLDIPVIPRPRLLPQSSPPLDHGKDSTNLGQPGKSRQNKRILQAHVGDPRRDPIPNSKRHRIPDNDHGNHRITAQVFVTVDTIRDAELNADCVCGGNDEHGDDETEPVDVVVGAYAPKD